MRGRDGRRGQGGRLSGEGGSGAAAADARRLPTPAAPSAPQGRSGVPAAPSPPGRQCSRIPASPTLQPPVPPEPGRCGAGRLRALRGAAGGAASPTGSAGTTAISAASGSAAAGSPRPWVPHHPVGGRRGHGARTSRPGAGTARRSSPASPPPSLGSTARPRIPPPSAPTPPAPVPLQSPARSTSTHPLPHPHCADPAPPSLPHLHRLLRAARPRSLRSPALLARMERAALRPVPLAGAPAGGRLRGEASAMERGSGRKPLSPRRVHPRPPITPPLAVFKTAPAIIIAMKTKTFGIIRRN